MDGAPSLDSQSFISLHASNDHPINAGHKNTAYQPDRLQWLVFDVKLTTKPIKANIYAPSGLEKEPCSHI